MAKTHSSLTGADLHAPQAFGNENATVEMCFKKPCNTKDDNDNYTNILSMSVALQ